MQIPTRFKSVFLIRTNPFPSPPFGIQVFSIKTSGVPPIADGCSRTYQIAMRKDATVSNTSHGTIIDFADWEINILSDDIRTQLNKVRTQHIAIPNRRALAKIVDLTDSMTQTLVL